jgi:hypothetical protein
MTDLTNPEVMAHRLFQINIAIKPRAAAVAAALAPIMLLRRFECFIINCTNCQVVTTINCTNNGIL